MIIDTVGNAHRYAGLSARLNAVLTACATGRFDTLGVGRHEIDGTRVFCLVQHYETKPAEECQIESHRDYIDVQLVVSGEEAIAYAPVSLLAIAQPFEETGDKALYAPAPCLRPLLLRAGMFAIFFPEDAHQPCCRVQESVRVHKVVVKVAV